MAQQLDIRVEVYDPDGSDGYVRPFKDVYEALAYAESERKLGRLATTVNVDADGATSIIVQPEK